MTTWEHSDEICYHELSVDGEQAEGKETLSCTRPAMVGHDRCPYHLPSKECDLDLNEDFQSRLESLGAGELTIDEEPLTFFDTTFEELDLDDIDLSPLGGRELELDLRYSTVEDIVKLRNLTIPFPVDFTGMTADGMNLERSTIGDLHLQNGDIKSEGITLVQTTVEHDIRAQSCNINSTLKITGGNFGIIDLSDAEGTTVAINRVEAARLNMTGATFQGDEVILKPKQIDHIDATSIQCRTLKLTPSTNQGLGSEKTDSDETAAILDLTNGTVTRGVTVRDIDLRQLIARDTDTPELKIRSLDFVSIGETCSRAGIKATGEDLDRLSLEDADVAEPVIISDVDAETVAVDRSRVAKLHIEDAEIEALRLDAQVETFAVQSSQLIDLTCEGRLTTGLVYQTDVLGATALQDVTSRSVRFVEAELNGCTVTGAFGRLVLYNSTISRQAHLSVRDTEERVGSGSVFITETSGSFLSLSGNEADEDDSSGTIDRVELRHVDLSKKLHIADCSPTSVKAINVDVPDVSLEGTCPGNFRVEDSFVDRELAAENSSIRRFEASSVEVTRIDFRSVNSDVFELADGSVNGLSIDTVGSESSIELRQSAITRTTITASEGSSIELDDTRINGKFRLKGPKLESVSVKDSTVRNADLEFQGETLKFNHSQVTETTTFTKAHFNALEIRRSHLPRLDLTSDSSVPVADEIEFTHSDLPNARLESGEGDLTSGSFTARETTLREAEMSDFSTGGAVDFAHSNLTDAELREADFRGADLTNTLLSRADLSGANLKWANLQGAVFGDVQITDGTRFVANKEGRILQDPDRTEADIEQELASKAIDPLPEPDAKQAKTIYGRIKSLAMATRHSEIARRMHRHEKRMDLQTNEKGKLQNLRKGLRKLWYLATGYEIGPGRVVITGGILISAFGVAFASPLVVQSSGAYDVVGGIVNGMMFSLGVFFNVQPGFYTLGLVTQYLVPILAGFGAIFVATLLYTVGQRASV